MNAKLRALTVAIGTLIVGGVAWTVYRPAPGVTRAELIDAGIADGVSRERICRVVRQKVNGRFEHRWARMPGRAFGATKEAVIVREAVDGWFIPDTDAFGPGLDCIEAPSNTLTAQQDEADEPYPCACSSGAACEWFNGHTLQWAPAPRGDTFSEGQWRGAGCVRRPCVVFAHGSQGPDEAWPAGCPQ